ncbi:hypothetical protein SLEP1_g7315 [Rubroshorea leprosula]|uniref:Uncharacterized protein n=1 Tax=Rubroshorea leprosula TaxID=152421 RepID=A0AAV5I718_9ROSI|nr:hypothetical protein SLEP1_g7315 [Rubroshorea leprosula]
MERTSCCSRTCSRTSSSDLKKEPAATPKKVENVKPQAVHKMEASPIVHGTGLQNAPKTEEKETVTLKKETVKVYVGGGRGSIER